LIQGVRRVNDLRRTDAASQVVRVRVWFGRLPIVDYTTSHDAATTQALGLGRRFSGLRVTVEPDDSQPAEPVGAIG
jgi:hypothetical protein